MQIYLNANLQPYHTFGIEQYCRVLVEVDTIEALIEVYQRPEWLSMPKLILGQGSNVLFTTFYDGVVIVNRLKGISVTEEDSYYRIYAYGGEDWPGLVEQAVYQGIGGLENLAMIPGCAGSAPIQNIGAYGVEFKDICDYVDYLCLDNFKVCRLPNEECCFGYRDSVFKHRLYQQSVVVGVGLRMPKVWIPRISYGSLSHLPSAVSIREVFEHICQIRREKLPDPLNSGNAGSFFKNPVISDDQYQALKTSFPDLVSYRQEKGVKLAAGWLIDQCGLKGFQVGGARVHPQQALVLVNHKHATAEDVIQLAGYVCRRVKEVYGVSLEHEVRFIAAKGETYLNELLQRERADEDASG